ncbi:hypothetical protein LCGC14_0595430 [marine sediment metagenome]|uniref:Trm112p-like protein n=1 Tax=marine sediment metagenome TaxID=412755 RepID=A0A0F9RVX4_9ZZZZ|nr:MAG: Trm112p-like protein [Candidatus Lokiarchaeum sp. GC14_75]HEC38703.1 hypothetical protein [bacterium]
MKPWLFDILACPIDKYFPLKLYIFSFETKFEDLTTLTKIFEKREITSIEKEEIVIVSQENEKYFIRDNIIIEKTDIKNYFDLIISSIKELDNIVDKSANRQIQKCLEMIQLIIKPKVLEFYRILDPAKLKSIIPELYFLNKIKLEIEIESGLIFCKNCKRWYPIIDTIPQMLPDEYRNEEEEISFLKNNRNLLDKKFFDQELKPFNI